MITVNGYQIGCTRFPDGTPSFKLSVNHAFLKHTITWKYDSDDECIAVWNIVHHIRSHIQNAKIKLILPYIPNARMDRVKNADEIFTLKWFAEFINALNFDAVEVLDAHSDVSLALIDRVINCDPFMNIGHVMDRIGRENLILCFPDKGSEKRYRDMFRMEYVVGNKHRDWGTGQIKGLEIEESERVDGRKVLIIDDICSRGGTFTHTARALKDAGAGEIYLYVSHCEDTIHLGDVLTDGLISRVFTTDSIYHGESDDKISVL